ncbi:MAG: DUF2344 domain-containing protein [Epulopiscium sp.]|mgnify:CR=1 FL=1|nr:DUF2344 domain-containing protein [Candidatus Epulonipiscium sp.]
MKVRIKFTKSGNTKFVGHLDLIRLFQRCIKRAKLPIKYSKGYNPHQLMYIALPLPIGATSESEYMDLDLNEDCNMENIQIKHSLNKVLPVGLKIEDVVHLGEGDKIGMAAVDSASYKIFINKKDVPDDFIKKGESFFSQKEIWVIKKGKKKVREINIKHMIQHYSMEERDKQWTLDLQLATGSRINLKPETVLKKLYEENQWKFREYTMQIHRTEIFSEMENQFIPLLNLKME